ncbi:hypothetical protein FACS189449_05630 [Alphaproteobacteria bacterium]|nr:hypothetical protein FACS189449_05630 [Alphaproteobacteria bacterium]
MRSKRFASYFVLASMVAFGVVSADSYVAGAANDVYVSDASKEPDREPDKDSKKRRGGVVYFLVGIGGSFSDNDLKADVKHTSASDAALQGYQSDAPDGDGTFSSGYKPWLASKGYGDAKITDSDGADVNKFEIIGSTPHVGNNKGDIVAVLGVGYVVFLQNNYYIGVEGMFDIGKSPESHLKNGNVDLTMKTSGMIPSATVRVGYCTDWHGVSFYIKAGCALVSSKVECVGSSDKLKMSKVVPVLAVGMDFPVSNSLAARLEFEHRFEGKKDGHMDLSDTVIKGDPEGEDANCSRSISLQQKTKSYAVRFVFSLSV